MNATYTLRAFVHDRYKLIGHEVDYETAIKIKEEYEGAGYYVQVVEIINGISRRVLI